MRWGSWAALAVVATSLWACGDSAEHASEAPENVGTSESGLTKGTPGARVGDSDYCGTSAGTQCALGEGDCDVDQQCQTGLVCVAGNLDKRGALSGDACAPLHCRDGVKDGNETSIDCGGSCGWDCTVTCDAPNGSASKCSSDCPCAVGEGQCNSAAECESGLICGNSNGAAFQLLAGTDVCWGTTCQNGAKDGTETAIDCGGSCAPCAPPVAGSAQVALNHAATVPIVIAPHTVAIHNEILTIANELRDKLNAIIEPSGTPFVVQESSTPSGISLGINGDFAGSGWPYEGYFRPSELNAGGVIRPDRLAEREHYVLRTPAGTNRVVVAGATIEALRHATWDLLKQVGYRHYFATPTWEIIPKQQTLVIPPLAFDEKPAFFARSITFLRNQNVWPGSTHDELRLDQNLWRKHNRLDPIDELEPAHAYSQIMVWYGNQHGGAYPAALTTNPAVGSSNRQFCLTATANVAGVGQVTALDTVREWAAQLSGSSNVIPVSPNTVTLGWASAAAGSGLHCNDINDPTYSNIANRVVAIANAAAEVQPNKIISVRVPQTYPEPPTLAIRQNVFIAVDSSQATDTQFVLNDQLSAWGASAREAGVVDRIGPANAELPGLVTVGTKELVERTHLYRSLGVQQYSADLNWGWGLAGPSVWALYQALWDAEDAISPETYRDDFLTRAFTPATGGSASTAARRFYAALEGKPFWSESVIGELYGALQQGFAATSDPEVEARLTDMALYTRYLELYRKFWNRCSSSTPSGEQAELKELIRFLYSTRDTKLLRSRDVAAGIMADVPPCPAGTTCTDNGCINGSGQLTGAACVLPEYGVNCPSATPTAACGTCSAPSTTCNVMKNGAVPNATDIQAFINAGVSNYTVFDVGLVRPFSRDLVPHQIPHSALPDRLTSIYTVGPTSLFVQRPSASGPLTAHVRKYGANQVLKGQLSQLLGGAVVDRKVFGGTDIETDWIFDTAGSGVHRLRIDDNFGRMFTTVPTGTRVALPVGYDDTRLALNYRWSGYFMVPAGTQNVAGWSQADGAYRRYRPTGANTWEQINGFLSDHALGHACTDPRIVIANAHGSSLDDYFVIPIPANKPVTTDEIWLFNDGSAGTAGERHLFSVPPYLYQSPDRLLVPRELTPSAGKTPCTSSADCAQGEYCEAGLCHSEGDDCTSNGQCAPSQTCQQGTCGGTGNLGDSCTDGSCIASLVCGVDNGQAFDKPPGRYCWAPGCGFGSSSVWCGTLDSPCGKCLSNPVEPTCQPSCTGKVCGDNSDDGCGGTCVLCDEREGECHKDGECTPGLICGQGAGPRFGLTGVQNACWKPICQSLDPSEIPCETTSSTCGLCPACQPNCTGKDYGDDGCGGSCGECAENEWEGPGFECFGALGLKSSIPDGLTPADYVTERAGTIGGAFEVTHQGQAQYTVPLTLPPGRGGMQPSLALSYNSAGGNGDLGQGWSISGLEVITRCPETIAQDGAARGVKDTVHNENDLWGATYDSVALCLNGARLFAVPGSGSELQYRTEIDSGVKVVAVDADDLEAGFLAYYPDGRIATFAHLDALPDPEPLQHIWATTRVEDRAGNYMLVEHDARAYGTLRHWAILRPKKIWYAGHSDGTAPDTLVEFHYERRPDLTNGYRDGTLFLNDEILRTVSVSLGEMPMREYRLEHTVLRPGGASTLTRLDECVPAFEGDSEFVCKPPTFFDYENEVPGLTSGIPIGFHPNNPQSAQFDVIPDMPLDMNGDGVDDLLMVVLDSAPSDGNTHGWDKHLEILMSGRERINTEADANIIIPVDVHNAPEIFNVIDYDLDGRDDLLMEHPVVEGNYTVLTYKDSGFEVIDLGIRSSVEHQGLGGGNGRTYVLDADGDGVRDILRCVAAFPGKNDSYYKGPFTWTLIHVPDLTERPIALNQGCFGHYIAADANGSGRQSLLIQTHAYLNESTEITREETYLSISFENAEYGKEGTVTTAIDQTFIPVSSTDGQAAIPLDANGDGITDLLNYFDSGYLETCLGTGRNDGFNYDCHPAHNHFNGEDIPPYLRTEAGNLYRFGPVLDVNGDGRDDVLIAGPGEPNWRVLESSVVGTDDEYYLAFSGWRVRELPGAPPTTWSGGKLSGRELAMDINGDGLKDFVQKPTGGYGPANLEVYVRKAPHVPKLIGVQDGLGGRIEIEYGTTSVPVSPPAPGDPLATHFAEGAYGGIGSGSCDYDDRLHCRTPRHAVVRRHREFQGPTYLTTFVREFLHNYNGARIGLDGRGYLGFNFHVVAETASGHASVSWLDNTTRDPATGAFPFLGRETSRVELSPVGDGALMITDRDTQHEYRVNGANERILTPYAHIVTESKTETRDGTTADLGSVEHTVTIDEYGNQTSIISNWSGAGREEEERVITTYAHEDRPEFVEAWLVNLPASRTVRSSGISGESQQGAVSRRTDFEYYDTGLLERSIVEPSNTLFTLATRFGRDDYGNVTSLEECPGLVECSATVKRTTTFDFEDRQVFPELTTDAEGYSTETEFHHGLGLVTKTTENGKSGTTTLTSYAVPDGFGRTRVEKQPDGRLRRTSYKSVVGDSMRVVSSIDGGPTTKVRYDELGRPLSVGTTSLGGAEFTRYTTYDVLGRVANRSRPLESFSADNRIEYDYDGVGRPTFVAELGDAQTSICYVGLVSCAIDTENNARCTEEDHRGRVLFAGDPTNLSEEACVDVAEAFAATPISERVGVAYTYGPFSKLERAIRMPEDKLVTELSSDQLGRPKSRMDVGSGTTSFTYTHFGELKTLTDSNSLVTFEHDKLDRRVSRTVDPTAAGEANTTSAWAWREDVQKRLDFKSVAGIETTVDYDEFGRVSDVTQNIDGEDFVTSIDEYDADGRPRFVTYPGDAEFRIENVYDPVSGILKEVKAAPLDEQATPVSYWKLDDLDEFGQPKSETFGNGLKTTRTYHELTGLPHTIVTGAQGQTPVQDLTYTFHDSRELESVADANGVARSYTYDEFGRVDQVLNGTSVVADFAYTSFGSLEVNAKDWTYTYDPASPHSVDEIEDDDGNTSSFEYNTNGTLSHRSAGALPELNVEYTDFQKPRKLWSTDEAAATTYDYDADENKVVKRTPTGATIYFGKLYYREENTATGEQVHHYMVSNGKSVIAEVSRTVPAVGDAEEPLTRYLHGDRLGSVQVVTDADGAVVERREFDVFGESSTTTSAVTKLGYTGHWQEPEAGLVDMGGRFYDPQVGQFLSSDPVIGSLARSESFNSKAYVANNPLGFTDPSGFQQCDELYPWCKGGIFSPGEGTGGIRIQPVGTGTFGPYNPGHSEGKFTPNASSKKSEGIGAKLNGLIDGLSGALTSNDVETRVSAQLTAAGLGANFMPYFGDYAALWFSVVHFGALPSWSAAGDVGLDLIGAIVPGLPSMGSMRRAAVLAAATAGTAATAAVIAAKAASAARSAARISKSVKCYGMCQEFASRLQAALVNKGIEGVRMTIHVRKYGRLISDTVGPVAETGKLHEAIRVGDTVFDNLRPQGIPLKEFLDDLGLPAPGAAEITETVF